VAGPRRVGDLLRLEDVVGKRDNPAELIGVLVGMDVAEPALRPAAAPNDYALRFNRVTARRLAQTESLGRALAMASHRLGAAAKAALLDLVAIDRTLDGEGSVEDLMRYLASGGSDHEKLRQALEESVNHRLPVLRAEGVF